MLAAELARGEQKRRAEKINGSSITSAGSRSKAVRYEGLENVLTLQCIDAGVAFVLFDRLVHDDDKSLPTILFVSGHCSSAVSVSFTTSASYLFQFSPTADPTSRGGTGCSFSSTLGFLAYRTTSHRGGRKWSQRSQLWPAAATWTGICTTNASC